MEVTTQKFLTHYQRMGYEIVETEEEVYDIDTMDYKELQELYSKKFNESPIGVSKKDIIERLNEVL